MRVIRFIMAVSRVMFMAIIVKFFIALLSSIASIAVVIWKAIKQIGAAFIFIYYGTKASIHMGYRVYIDNITSIWRQLFPK